MFRIVFATLVAGCVLAGCSATGLVYDNLPWLLRNRIDARFDLTSTQSSLLKTQLTEFAEWHRREELPRYAVELERLERDLADELTRAELEQYMALFMQARRRLVSRAIPFSADFLHTVDDEQIAEFEQTHREDIEEDSERLQLSPAEQAEARYERTMDNLEDWFGDFDAAQRQRIRELLATLPDTYASWLRRREFQHQRFVRMLRSQPTRAEVEESLRRWWLNETAELPRQMLDERDLFWRSAKTFVLAVDQLITERQRARALAELRGYREDFERLSKAVPAAPRRSSKL